MSNGNESGSAPEASRGQAARRALIEAGIELFGHRGLEGATTREIARAARQNIAAIPYYFGSKEGLYLAIAGHMLDTLVGSLTPLVEATETLLASGEAGAEELLSALQDLVTGFLKMLTRDETLALSRIMSREQLEPTAAFDLFYERAISRMHRCLAGLLDQYSGIDPDPVDSILRAHILLGSILGFRAANATVLRRTGWKQLGPEEVQRIIRIACEHSELYARALREQTQMRRPASSGNKALPSGAH